jgi:hypothetical protein
MSTSDHVSDKNALGGENHSEKENEPQGITHISVGDMIAGTAAQQLTPFERKAALINASVVAMILHGRLGNMLMKVERLTNSASENTRNVFGCSVALAISSTWPGPRVLVCWLLRFCKLDHFSERHSHSHSLAVRKWAFQQDSKVSYSPALMLV